MKDISLSWKSTVWPVSTLTDVPRPRVMRVLAFSAVLAGGSLVATIQTNIAAALRFDRVAIQSGEWWRLLTGNIVQGGLAHWALNMSGLALIVAIFADEITISSFAAPALVAALGVGVGLYFLNPLVIWYVGLSGVLHGVFAAFALRNALWGSKLYVIAIAVLVAKLTYEQIVGPLAVSEALVGLPVVVSAHLYGALSGAMYVLIRGRSVERQFQRAAR